jgi:hypothetical protein
MKQTIIIAFIVITFLSGCVGGYYVGVNSIIDTSYELNKNYCLALDPASNEMDGESLLFREFAEYVDVVLASKGFVKIDVLGGELSKLPLSDYPYTIFLKYRVVPPKTEYGHKFSMSSSS